MEGYIKVWRKFMQTSFYQDSYAVHLAIHLLLKANHKDMKITFNKKELEIKRGQCIVGRNKLHLETGISASTARNKLELLANVHFLDIKPNNKFSLVSICNYNGYQNVIGNFGQQNGQQKDNQRTTKGQPKDTYNNDKNVKNDKKITIPPDIKDVLSYCQERKNNVDAEAWYNHYEAKGWLIGKTKMVNWKAAVKTWEKKDVKAKNPYEDV